MSQDDLLMLEPLTVDPLGANAKHRNFVWLFGTRKVILGDNSLPRIVRAAKYGLPRAPHPTPPVQAARAQCLEGEINRCGGVLAADARECECSGPLPVEVGCRTVPQ